MDEGLIVPIAGMLTGIILGLPLIRALVRHIERQAVGGGEPPDEALRAEVQELRQRIEAMDDVRERLTDLEERQEFTERVLARQRQPGALGGGS